MRKILILAVLALAALAAVPAMASATVTANGEELPVGTKITGIANGVTLTSGGSCTSSTIEGEVIANGSKPEVAVLSSSFIGSSNGWCETPYGKATVRLNATRLCNVKGTPRWFFTWSGSCSSEYSNTPELQFEVKGLPACHFGGSWWLSYTSIPKPELFTLNEEGGWSLYSGPEWCPSAMKVEATYRFTTESGARVSFW